MPDNYDILLQKLRRFIRKYYLNRLLRGGIWFVALFALFFILVNAFEYYTWSSPALRTALFYIYLSANVIILISFVIIPMLKIFRIGKTINDEEAAGIIGRHFPEVSDKLINTIQLRKQNGNTADPGLLQASIDQKTRSLHPVPFVKAVDFGRNKKYLKYAIPPVLALVILFLASPSMITEPSQRLIRHRTAFERPVPFRLEILNDRLEAVQHDDFTLRVRATGESLPASMSFSSGSSLIPFRETPGGSFAYTLNNLTQDVPFSIIAADHSFGPYYLKVLPKPVIINYDVSVDYPGYTGKAPEVFENSGDLIVPEGSRARWKIYTRDTRSVTFRFPEDTLLLDAGSSNVFEYSRQLMESTSYAISSANEFLSNPDTLAYAVTVIKDNYPACVFEEFRDSVYEKRLYFRGQISDDYGFSALTFNYEFLNHFDSARVEGKIYREPVAFSGQSLKQLVFHYFDLDRLDIRPGDEVQYYFEVWDNDEVNGYKSSRSHRMVFRAPTLEEISDQADTENREIKDEMEDVIRESRVLQEQIEKLNKQLINKENLNWQDKERIRNLLSQQQQLQEKIDLLEQKNRQNVAREQQYKTQNENILRKQQELNELFNEVLTDEMKEMYEELQQMLDELRKEDVQEMLEKMEMSAEDIEEGLDRNLELFKQLEFDKKLTEAIEKLEEMSEEQKKLSEESIQKGKKEREDLSKQQESLNESFESLREDLDELDELNEGLEDPNRLEDTEDMENSIEEDMEKSLEELQDGSMNKAGKMQQSAGDKMKEMSNMLFNMQMQMQTSGAAEDVRVLREILENLIIISFDQEDIIEELRQTSFTDPRYQEIVTGQFELRENMRIVEDSLFALSKRQSMIKPFVNREVDRISRNMQDAEEYLNDRKKGNAAASQQYAMTSVNNLALLLSESLSQMQSMMMGNSSCPNPGPGGSGKVPKNMSDLQKQLNQQMQQMKDGQQNKGPGGKQGMEGRRSTSEQFARMAAEQEAIRRQMQQYLEELKSSGETGVGGLNKLMEDMEQTELDLVNKQLTEETMKRQQEILTRLLKHEKAMREREKEERRESNEAKSQEYSNPEGFLEYKKLLLKEVELLKTVPPDLKPYYKRKVNEYFYNFGN